MNLWQVIEYLKFWCPPGWLWWLCGGRWWPLSGIRRSDDPPRRRPRCCWASTRTRSSPAACEPPFSVYLSTKIFTVFHYALLFRVCYHQSLCFASETKQNWLWLLFRIVKCLRWRVRLLFVSLFLSHTLAYFIFKLLTWGRKKHLFIFTVGHFSIWCTNQPIYVLLVLFSPENPLKPVMTINFHIGHFFLMLKCLIQKRVALSIDINISHQSDTLS